MKVVVLGKNGQLGQCLFEQFSFFELQPHDATFTTQLFGKSECDLTEFDQIREVLLTHTPDVIINAAAYTAVDAAEDNAELADNLNHKAVSLIAKLCYEFDSVLIHISTDYVFDGRGNKPYLESSPTAPQGVYGSTKLLGEQAMAEAKCKQIIIRSAWIFSEHGSNFLKTMLRLGDERDHLSVVDDQYGTPTYAQDLARAIIGTLPYIANNTCLWGTYHYAGNNTVSWFEFAQQIFSSAKALNLKTPGKLSAIATTEYPTPAPRPAYSALSTELFTDTFAIAPSDWRAGIDRTLAKMIK